MYGTGKVRLSQTEFYRALCNAANQSSVLYGFKQNLTPKFGFDFAFKLYFKSVCMHFCILIRF